MATSDPERDAPDAQHSRIQALKNQARQLAGGDMRTWESDALSADLMVNYDLPWDPNRIEQRFGRIHRIGQTEPCHLWNLVADETREGDVYRRLLEKLAEARRALGSSGEVNDVELAGMIASIAHLAYHLGAIRQIDRDRRGPKEGTF